MLEPGPQPGESCTTGLYPGLYGDSLVPAHLAAYAVLVALIAWTRPPGRAGPAVLAATAVAVLVSLAWPAPVAVAGLAAFVATPPAVVWAAIATWQLLRQGRDDRAPVLLWLALLVGLPATFISAYFNGAGLFCF